MIRLSRPSRPWWSAGYLLGTLPIALLAAIPVGLLALPWALAVDNLRKGRPPGVAVFLIVLGAGLIALTGPLVAAPVAAVERRRLGLPEERRRWGELLHLTVLGTAVPLAYGAVALLVISLLMCVVSPLLVRLGGPVAVGFGTVHTVGEAIPGALVALLLTPFLPYAVSALATGQSALARLLLSGDPAFVAVDRSRTRLVDAFDSERRRLERDLHDGAQQRLIGLTLQLGLARWDVPPGTPGAEAVAKAHDQARELMTELRELIHGIHPHVLTERGLPAALRDLADRCPVPAGVIAEVPRRLPERVEATAYFVVAEALTNVARHAGALGVQVTARHARSTLTIEVADDGRGGATPAAGSGLTGLADRVAATGGRMLLSSPPGGPTRLRVELPCR